MLRSTTFLASGIDYDPVGNLTNLNYGNGLPLSRNYNPTNQISSITIPVIINTAYSYDTVGNITGIADTLDSTKTKSYSYDALDRLQNAQGPWGNLNWTYDANGNRLSQKNGTNFIFTYEGNRLTTVTNSTTATYSYDANGNTLDDGMKQFIYNQNSRLIKTVEDGKTLGEYTYNGKGERVIKKTGPATTSSASSQNVIYHYDRNGKLIEETAGDGKFLADYVYLDGTPLALIRKQENNEETFFYHNDHLGTPKVMTDKLGKVVWNVEFDPFGNDISAKARQGGYIRNVENNLRFPGQYYDAETGLSYNYFRDYNPKTGRYIQSDPIGLRGGLNVFNYVQNNPLILVDPFGLCPAGTHEATPDEVKQILAAAKDIEGQNLSYKDIKCNQFVDRSINNAFPKSLSQEYTTSQIRQGEGPFEKTDFPAVGELALFNTPGHVVLISGTNNGKVSQFKGSQTSTGPNTVNLPDYFWQKRLNATGNVNYYKVCLPN
jgi:RHS repeat-associated protein